MAELIQGLVAMIPVAVVLAIVFAIFRSRRSSRLSAWRAAALAAGLRNVRVQSDVFETSLHGTDGPLQVTLEAYRRGKHNRGTRVRIRGLRHASGALSVRAEGLGTAVEKRLLGASELELGDPDFDRRCFVQGPAPLAFATLDAPRRGQLARLLQGSWAGLRVRASLLDGALQLELRETFLSPGRGVQQLLVGALDVARNLLAPEDLAPRIAANLGAECVPGVRLGLLRTLIRHFEAHPATRQAVLAARTDRDEEMRLRAGIALGAEGREALQALVDGAETSDGCRARALAALGPAIGGEQVEALLRRALAGHWPETACACLERLAALRRQEAEQALLEALTARTVAVSLAAARALRACGTVTAVAPLLEVAGNASDVELRHAARQAVGEIQSRLPGAGPGQLALAEGVSGALTVVETDGGRLSLADSPRPLAGAASDADDASEPAASIAGDASAPAASNAGDASEPEPEQRPRTPGASRAREGA